MKHQVKNMPNNCKTQHEGPRTGAKFDSGKPRFSLLPWIAMARVVDVLEDGAKTHGAHSWKTIPDAETRYRDALLRHQAAIMNGELIDQESGFPHTWHVACNALFLAQLDKTKRE